MPTRAISAVVALIVLAAGLAIFLFSPGTPNASPSTPSSSRGTVASSLANTTGPPINFTQAYLAHLLAYQNRTICTYSKTCVYSYAVLNDYGNQSEVVWQNQALGGPGNFSGLDQIQHRYQAITSIATTMNFTVLSIGASGDQVNAVMNVTGTSGPLGNFYGTIKVQSTYDYANGSWAISKEIWNFVVLKAPNALYPPGG